MAIRKIKSDEEIRAKKKRTQIIFGIFMMVILLLSTAGWFASEMLSSDVAPGAITKINYGGRTYNIQNEIYVLEENERLFYFFNLPNETRNVYLNESEFSQYQNQPLYLVNYPSSAQFLLWNLEGVYTRWQSACLEEGNCSEEYPIKDCSSNVIAFFESEEETRVEKQNKCIFIYGDPERGIDAISYNLLKII